MTQQGEPLAGLAWHVPTRVFVRGGRPQAAPIALRLPGAKYYTLRYLLAALLADGVSLVRNPARSDDTLCWYRRSARLALACLKSEAKATGRYASSARLAT